MYSRLQYVSLSTVRSLKLNSGASQQLKYKSNTRRFDKEDFATNNLQQGFDPIFLYDTTYDSSIQVMLGL